MTAARTGRTCSANLTFSTLLSSVTETGWALYSWRPAPAHAAPVHAAARSAAGHLGHAPAGAHHARELAEALAPGHRAPGAFEHHDLFRLTLAPRDEEVGADRQVGERRVGLVRREQL